MEAAREHGADIIDLGTSETDTAARASTRAPASPTARARPDGPVMLYYERDL